VSREAAMNLRFMRPFAEFTLSEANVLTVRPQGRFADATHNGGTLMGDGRVTLLR
jgi:hypothetical protein